MGTEATDGTQEHSEAWGMSGRGGRVGMGWDWVRWGGPRNLALIQLVWPLPSLGQHALSRALASDPGV